MASEAFTLALLLTLKDTASGGLDRFEAKLRSIGKTGEQELQKLDKLRDDLNRDLAIGGAGLAGLKVIKDGVQAAADYQAVITDLRASIAQTGEDGKINYNKLATEMMGAEAVAVRLGNKLPGTTADFAQMMQVMKQNGLDVKTIVDGAADAVGHLAVASNAVPKEIAADFARYGNLFKLRPEDFTPAADVFSRIYSSTGQTSAELIEAAKYFQGRIGQGLKIGGLEDAEKYTKLFGFMGKRGLTGSVAGMGLSNFFESYNTHRDKLPDLQAATGIKLDFYDKQGKFVGLDQVMEQMSQFDKLSAKDRTQWMETMFGTLGSQAANVMVDAKGWKDFNAEQAKTISLQEKSAMKAADYNNKMEALKGTLTNLKVAVFEPMLPGATAIVDKANEFAGIMQGFAKSHPEIMKYAVGFLAIGSASMVALSGVKALTTGVRLYKMTSTFARGEGLAGHLAQTTTATERLTRTQAGFVRQNETVQSGMVRTANAANTATKGVNGLGTSLVTADSKAVGLKKNLFSLNNVFKAVLVLEAVGFTWDQIVDIRKMAADWSSLQKGADRIGYESYNLFRARKSIDPATTEREITELTKQNPAAAATFELLRPDPRREARSMTSILQMGNDNVQKNLDPSKKNWTDMGMDWGKILTGKNLTWDAPLAANSPLLAKRQERVDHYASQPTRSSPMGGLEYATAAFLPFMTPLLMSSRISPNELADREIRGANFFQKRAPSLADPQVMAAFRQNEVPKMKLDQQGKGDLDNMLKLAFPESFAQSLTTQLDQSMTGMFDKGSQAFTEAMSSLQQPITGTAELFSGLPPTITPVGQGFATLPQPITDAGTAFGTLPQPIGDTAGAFNNLLPPAGRVPGALNNIFTSATNVAAGLDSVSVKLASWQPPQAQVVAIPGAGPAPATPMFGVPGRAIGGVVERDGFAYVHAGNVITPARATRGLSGFNQLMSLAKTRETDGIITKQFPILPDAAGNTSNAPVGRGDSPINLSVVLPPMSQSPARSFSAAPANEPASPFRSNTASDVRRVGIYESRSVTNFADRLNQATSLVTEFSRSKQTERDAMRSLSITRFADDVSRSRSSESTRIFDQVSSRQNDASTTSSAVNFQNTLARRSDRSSSISSLVSDITRSRDESRFLIDEQLVRDADRSPSRRPAASENQTAASTPSITVNAPFTFSPQLTVKTIEQVERELDRNYAAAKGNYLQQLRKEIDNRRQRA